MIITWFWVDGSLLKHDYSRIHGSVAIIFFLRKGYVVQT